MLVLSGFFKRTLSALVLTIFASTVITGDVFAAVASLPQPGTMVTMSKDYSYAVLKGLKINVNNPFDLDFVIDSNNQTNVSQEEASKLVNYFLAALTIDKENIWVNLSPYEQNRITDENLAITDLGKDLLKQDYILKQLSASLTHPESDTGKNYWNKADANSDLSKIWIVPQKAKIHEANNSAFITKLTFDVQTQSEENVSSSLVNILDEVRSDVNNGQNFANLRQIFHSIVLAQWFKTKLKDSFFKHYINQNKVAGIDIEDKEVKNKIWSQYVESFKQGAYNTVAKVKDSASGRIQKQKYFCGGIQSSSIVLDPSATSSERRIEGDATHLSINLRNYDGEVIKQSSSVVVPFTPTAKLLKKINKAESQDDLLDAYVELIKMGKNSALLDRLGNGKQFLDKESKILAKLTSDFILAHFDFADRSRAEQKLLFENKDIADFYINQYDEFRKRFTKEFQYGLAYLPLDVIYDLSGFDLDLLDTLELSYITFLKDYFGGEKGFSNEKFTSFARSLNPEKIKEQILETALPTIKDMIVDLHVGIEEINWLNGLGYDYSKHMDKDSDEYRALEFKLYLESKPYLNSKLARSIVNSIIESDNLKLDIKDIEDIYNASLETVKVEQSEMVDNPAYEMQFNPWGPNVNGYANPEIPAKIKIDTSYSETSFSFEKFEKELKRYVSVKNSEAALKYIEKVKHEQWLPESELESQLVYDLIYEAQMDPRDITPILAMILTEQYKDKILQPVAQLFYDIRLQPEGPNKFLDWQQFSRLLSETEAFTQNDKGFTVVPGEESTLWRVTEAKQSSSIIFINNFTEAGRALNALRKPKTEYDKFVESLQIALTNEKTRDAALIYLHKRIPRLPKVALAVSNYHAINKEINALYMIENVDLDFLYKILSQKVSDFVVDLSREFLRFSGLNKSLAVTVIKDAIAHNELRNPNVQFVAARQILKTVPVENIRAQHINKAAELLERDGYFDVIYTEAHTTIPERTIIGYEESEEASEWIQTSHTDASPGGATAKELYPDVDWNDYSKPIYSNQEPIHHPARVEIRALSKEEIYKREKTKKLSDIIENILNLLKFSSSKISELLPKLVDTTKAEEIGQKTTAIKKLSKTMKLEDIEFSHIEQAYQILERGNDFDLNYTPSIIYETSSKEPDMQWVNVGGTDQLVDVNKWQNGGQDLDDVPAKVEFIEITDTFDLTSEQEDSEDKISSNVLLDGGIDAAGLDIETEVLSSSVVEFGAFDPISSPGFSFIITKFEKKDAKTALGMLK